MPPTFKHSIRSRAVRFSTVAALYEQLMCVVGDLGWTCSRQSVSIHAVPVSMQCHFQLTLGLVDFLPPRCWVEDAQQQEARSETSPVEVSKLEVSTMSVGGVCTPALPDVLLTVGLADILLPAAGRWSVRVPSPSRTMVYDRRRCQDCRIGVARRARGGERHSAVRSRQPKD